jgi:hypothetical protein
MSKLPYRADIFTKKAAMQEKHCGRAKKVSSYQCIEYIDTAEQWSGEM